LSKATVVSLFPQSVVFYIKHFDMFPLLLDDALKQAAPLYCAGAMNDTLKFYQVVQRHT